MKTFLFVLSSLAVSSVVNAVTVPTPGTKLLTCVDRGSFLGSCKLTTMDLAPAQPFEVDLNATYKFPCKGPAVDFKIKAQTSPTDVNALADYPLTFTSEPRIINAVGYGPFKILDGNTIKTQNRPFDKICDLTIESIVIKASPATKNKWQDDLKSLNNLLLSYRDNVDAWGALALLEPAFNVYDRLVANVSADFGNKTELLNAAKDLLACTDGTNEDGCETVIGKIIDSEDLIGFSDEEGRKLSKLQTALFNADFSGVLACTNTDGSCLTIDQFLKKYLTTDDIAKLKAAREKLKIVVEAPGKLLTYENLVKNTENAITTLNATIKEYE